MTKLAALFLASAGVVFATSSLAAPPASPPNGVLGVLDTNGNFRPLGAPRKTQDPAKTRDIIGTLKLTLNIAIVSTLPPETPVLCGLNAQVSGINSASAPEVVIDSAQTIANVSGTTATCQVVLPYEWHLSADDSSALSEDTLVLNYSVTAVNSAGAGRTVSSSLVTISVPRNGQTTSYSLSARI